MTFQEALAVFYADLGTHDQLTIGKAVGALYFFRDNILELEDYETDQLYQALHYIENNKLGGIKMNSIKGYTHEPVQDDHRAQYLEAASRISDLETNKQQLHHLLIHVGEQLEEVEDRYQMIEKAAQATHKNAYMGSGLAELRSLIEIAKDHNRKFLKEQ